MRHYICGCGGAGSVLIPQLAKLVRDDIYLIDNDVLENKNLDRQLFTKEHIGQKKVHALAKMYEDRLLKPIAQWFHEGIQLDFKRDDYIWCCADNDKARKACLTVTDMYSCSCIIAANEYTDAEAYYYNYRDQGTINDPRIVYPNILTNHADNPLAPESCQGTAQIANPQLGIANSWAANLALQLFWFYNKVAQELTIDTEDLWPIHHIVNKFKFSTIKKGDRKLQNNQ